MNDIEDLKQRVRRLEAHQADTKKLLRFGSKAPKVVPVTMRLTPEQIKKNVELAIIRLQRAGFAYQKPAKHIESGEVYEVLGLVLDERTKLACVVYQGADEINWSRPLSDFLKRFRKVVST